MPRFAELLPEPAANRWEEVIAAWAALLRSETMTPLKRMLARQAIEESLMPEELAWLLGTTQQHLRSFFTESEPLELEHDATMFLKLVLGLPGIALRVGLGQLRLSDLLSPSGMGSVQKSLVQRCPALAHELQTSEVVALLALLSGHCGDEPGSERKLLPEQGQRLPPRRR